MLKRPICFALLIVLFLNAKGQVRMAKNSAEIFLGLKKLNVLGSILYIAAHPDDENNSLLPWLAKEKLYRTAYLSLTRGDGGQNLIGSEQGIELGLIRTQELLAARRIDGAEQYFSTAYEFGFSKSAKESLDIWGHEKILGDVVWVIRQYQPDVIITRFPGDKRAGHGHHAASSILANEAFAAAADPSKFPEQFKFGVKPWQAKRIMWNTYNFGNTNTTSEDQLKYDVGVYNALLGESFGELGGEARSMHKSQGEGRPKRKGPIMEYFVNTGGIAPKSDLMDGVNNTWSRVEGGKKIQGLVTDIISKFQIDHPEASVPALVELYKNIQSLPEGKWKENKLKETQNLIESCGGIFAEATASTPAVVQGEQLSVSILINNRISPNVFLKRVHFETFDSSMNTALLNNSNLLINQNILVPDDKKISQPYWLEYPQKEGSFEVRDQTLIGKAENEPAYKVSLIVSIAGTDFTIERAVEFKTVDPVKGELNEPLVILPKAEVNYQHNNYISTNGSAINAIVHFHYNDSIRNKNAAGIISPAGWSSNIVNTETLNKNDFLETSHLFPLPHNNTNVKYTFQANVKVDGKNYDQYRRIISYDHIPVITYFAKAQANVINVDLKIVGSRVGYIVGAGDKVPEELEQMGYKVTYLNENSITEENLRQYDAIIVGIRAFNINDNLTDKNAILNKYVENGGNMIVQYLKSNFTPVKKIIAGPYPFSVNPAVRVTEEHAKVTFLLPSHPVLNYPNKITEKDFEGWVQERSTYQADRADSHYEKPIGMGDTDEPQTDGSLLIAKYGKGNFVYMSLVLFRELPAGIPGAYRLMANCIALPKN